MSPSLSSYFQQVEDFRQVSDGKKSKGVSPTSKGTAGFWLVNAWVGENRVCVGQAKVRWSRFGGQNRDVPFFF